MKILLSQMRVRSGQPAANYRTMSDSIDEARAAGAELVVFPEMCLPGYFVGDEWERESFLRECEQLGRAVAGRSKGIHVLFGNVGVDWDRRGEDGRVRKFNACFHAFDGIFVRNEALGLPFWPKTLMPNYREFDDSRHFFDLRKLALEKGCQVADLLRPIQVHDSGGNPWRIGLGICEDAWVDDYSVSVLDALDEAYGVDFFVGINCSPYTFSKREKRQRTFGAVCARRSKPMLHVNCVGMQNIGKTVYGFDGSSGVLDSAGNPLFEGHFFTTENVFVEVSRDAGVSVVPTVRRAPQRFASRSAELAVALEGIVACCLEEWGIRRAVVGASGGVDSALSAVVLARLLGPENVFLINMPSRFNSDLTRGAAADLARNLGCPYAVVSIEESAAFTTNQLREVVFERSDVVLDVTSFVRENIQARDRGGRVLAGIAAALGAVFSCNANKSELTVGYSTLYGDQAGFLALLADLWKHDVYGLCYHYNTLFGREVVPRATLEVKPSAELSAEQDVTQGKGDPLVYEYHDYLFRSWVETWQRRSPVDLLRAYAENRVEELIGCERGLVKRLFPEPRAFVADLERWWNLYQGMGAVKRMQAPPVVALTQRAFGFDHRECIRAPFYGSDYAELKKQLCGSL